MAEDRVASEEELAALSIGSVVISGHHVVWHCQFGGWSSASGEAGRSTSFVWDTEKGRPRHRRFRVLLRKPGAPAEDQRTFVRSAFDFVEDPDATRDLSNP